MTKRTLTSKLPAECLEDEQARRIALIASSHAGLLARPLIGANVIQEIVPALWYAPDVIVAHGCEADPVFFFGNAAALMVFECDWQEFTAMPSRLSAEAPDRAERDRLLERVRHHGYVDDYAGTRISARGRRFFIPRATVWNLQDHAGRIHGQAATFPVPAR